MNARACRGCQAPIARDRVTRYCAGCQAQTCRYCHRRAGQHAPACRGAQARVCRRCRAPLFQADALDTGNRGSLRYCAACDRLPRCYACHRFDGAHTAGCPIPRRAPRPVPVVYDRVPPERLAQLYTTWYARLVRYARRDGAEAEAEDAVQDTVVELLERLHTLAYLDAGLLFVKVRWRARAIRRSPWWRAVTLTDPAELVDLEEMMVARAEGRPSTLAAPEPVGTTTPGEVWAVRQCATLTDPEDLVLAEQAMYDPTQPAAAGPG